MSLEFVVPVIMCGGSGKRLWPLSRENFPKQFLRLEFEKSLLQQTALRFSNNSIFASPLIISNYQYRFNCAEQLSEIGIKQADILLERYSRNTAPALSAAAHFVKNKYGGKALMLAVPSDHYFSDDCRMEDIIKDAIDIAKKGNIVTFGIKPAYPETGYGYIQFDSSSKQPVNKIIKFHEKPDLKSAEKMLKDGGYLWNSGIFLFSSEAFLDDLKRFEPEIYKLTQASTENAEDDLGFKVLEGSSYEKCRNISVDYAVMERTDKGFVCNWNREWKDIGSWQSLYELLDKNAEQNVFQGDVIASDTSNSFVRSNCRLTAVMGLDDVLIVDTQDVLLVANKSDSQKVKELVEGLKLANRKEFNSTTSEYRPWGHYEVIEDSADYKVKKIYVSPGKKLSLQKHMKRAEHWVIISGKAKITRGQEEFILERDQSTYIPNQCVHRIENIGQELLVFVEVQTGNYLGEDDIVRYEDDFGREREGEALVKKIKAV